ncbi:polyphosphate kinase 2 [Nonomuraea zeae]|uniref:polyphosphate kinase 2 n=1 Tax=Nonomuraea zeae TaxID=1642303 RepID=UPI001F0DB284|nr:polyphosphate kinase 2 [Nonomuraea zeae]
MDNTGNDTGDILKDRLLATRRHGESTVAPGELLNDLPHVRVIDDDDDDPVLVDRHGHPVNTWREYYPYTTKMGRQEYDRDKRLLQIELVKLQYWIKETGARLVILFEGRDAAGKGGTIKRFREHLNPRGSAVVALDKPGERESAQWYFQRYIAHLPAAGEMVFFDRSWYNRTGVERVMGFCTAPEYLQFLRQAPMLEQMLVEDGIHLIKFWFSVSRSEQLTRFIIRTVDPVRRWKLSPMDLASRQKWDEYTDAKEDMFQHTDTEHAPWTVIKSNDKKRARIEAIRHVLTQFDYDNKDHEVVGVPDPLIIRTAADVLDEDRDPYPGRRG